MKLKFYWILKWISDRFISSSVDAIDSIDIALKSTSGLKLVIEVKLFIILHQ